MAKGSGGTRSSSSSAPKGLQAAPAVPEPAPMADSLMKIKKDERAWLDLVQSGDIDKLSDEAYRYYRDKIYDARRQPLDIDSKYSEEEFDALTYYSGHTGFENINQGLNGQRKLSDEDKDAIAKIDKAMQKTKLKRDTVVFRGIDKEDSGKWKGYVSTARSIYDADKFRNDTKHLHAYLIPKGTPVAYIYGAGEDEYLLPRGFNLKKYRIK